VQKVELAASSPPKETETELIKEVINQRMEDIQQTDPKIFYSPTTPCEYS